MSRNALIAGCGDLGTRIGLQLLAGGWQVTGLRRNTRGLPPPIKPLALDLKRPETLSEIAGRHDDLVFCPTADGADEAAYRATYLHGLRNLLQANQGSKNQRLVFVSSTSVYAQNDGSWVDESSSCKPTRFNGRMMLEAERLALDSGLRTTVIRFSGIYGRGREGLLQRVRSGQARSQDRPPYWTNRIHQDDCAAMVRHVLTLDDPASLYVGTDLLPAPQHEVVNWLAERLAVKAPEAVDGTTANKRLSSQRIVASGFDFRYADFRSGYTALLESAR